MEDLKMKVKKYLMAVYIFIVPVAVICGCGVKYARGGNVLKEKSTICKETSSNVIKEEKKNNKDLYKNVPVYGKNEKGKIKKYLASLPDNLTVKEAKQRGIVIETYKQYTKKNPFHDIWLDFYKYAREGEKAVLRQKKTVTCLAKPYEAAIVVLRYTIEGDACYTYISFIGGEYYVFNDSSRDKFKAGSWDGYSETGTFKSLRKSKEIIDCKEEKNKYFYIRYMLFKKQGISRKRVTKIIKNNNGNNKYYDIFSYRYI